MSRATFHMLFDHLYIFFVEISIQVFAPICFLELPFFRATCVYRQGLYLLGCSHRPYSVTLTSSEAGCVQIICLQPTPSLPSSQTPKVSFHSEKITYRWRTEGDSVSPGKSLASRPWAAAHLLHDL